MPTVLAERKKLVLSSKPRSKQDNPCLPNKTVQGSRICRRLLGKTLNVNLHVRLLKMHFGWQVL